MELATEQPTQPAGFRKSGKFEINDIKFRDIIVDDVRILATGKKWQHFELSIASINGMWKEKWRRFGLKLLAAGVFLLLFPLSGPYLFGPLIYTGSGLYLIFFFMFIGLALVLVWLLVKREALQIYTPSGSFKIEGASGFVDDVWTVIRKNVRWT
jgi:hypothetical protein